MATTLRGFKIPVGIGKADHTYVTSDSPKKAWGCWGRSAGGTQICDGQGDFQVADCISQPSSHAGIIYGITGVCHQTANRILYPAGVTVHQAGWYSASTALYGTYGLNQAEWLKRRQRCGIMGARRFRSLMCGGDDAQKEAAVLLGLESEVDRRSRLSALAVEDESILQHEMRLRVLQNLQEKATPERIDGVLKAHTTLSRNVRSVHESLNQGTMDGKQMAEGINQRLRDFLVETKKELGDDAYRQLFNTDETQIELVDPEIAAQAHAHQ
jgi:hypothetical protein